MRAKVIDREEGTAQCMLERQHDAHRWAYTSEGGGHMITVGWTDEKGYKEWDCPGYIPTPWIEKEAIPVMGVDWSDRDDDMITYSEADIDLTMKFFKELLEAPKTTDIDIRDAYARHAHDGQVCRMAADIFDKWLEEHDERVRHEAWEVARREVELTFKSVFGEA